MLRWKDSVSFKSLQPVMVLAAQRVNEIYAQLAVNECWITSANDGRHQVGSRHYDGLALDFRTRNVPVALRQGLAKDVRDALGPEFDVLLESFKQANEHLHVEYQPK